ncbi:poly-beta-1,6-N-acetyl-D-glucosamine synthase IcaA [Peptoclostridium acidaminophilum DSM 3953]|uniref:Poly-beta-1,6-N-acetyl-D-glucosamine synthase IcaA n=2 Tax=Peptoclostridium acidaminophilum TaxID=1731 RepID=W8TH28_PEPAC|nr:poly-beta-1,6-N-acetyl-D-glucosamine synthase IcaA [Peptoclostridium acidaminophilum DSM 3953]
MMTDAIKIFIDGFSGVMFGYFIIVNFFYMILIAISWKRLMEFVRIVNSDITLTSSYTKPISVIVPAYNEQETIIDNIKSLLELDYPLLEVIVVNDGSSDETLGRTLSHFKLRKIDLELNIQIPCNEIRGVYSSFEMSNLVIVDKVNGGKADALNAGINVSKYPLVCAIDADCVIEKDALLRIVKPFLKYDETVAVGGIVRIANGCEIRDGKLIKARIPKRAIEIFQIVEYFRAFLTSRVGWEAMNALLIISGAFGLFKKSAVVAVGGYQKTIGEDMELTLRMHEHFRKKGTPYKIEFASDAVCWTQAPDTLKGLESQRIRWHRGLADGLLRHRRMIFSPAFGKVGMLSMPYFFFVEMLGPVIEAIGYIMLAISIYMGFLSEKFIYIFLMAFLFGILFSFSAIFFEQISYKRYNGIREILLLFLFSLLEQFLYRQLTVFWRIKAFWNYKKGSKQWGTIQRKSFEQG